MLADLTSEPLLLKRTQAALSDAIVKAQPDLREVAEVAAALARVQAGALAVDLTKAKQRRLRVVIARGLDQGWSDTRLREEIASVVGLDDRYTEAVERYKAGLLDNGVSRGKANQAALSYAKRLLRARASTIAATEVQTALLEAQRLMWTQQQEDGDLSRYAVRVWRVHKDERRCKVCRPMGGQRASLKAGSSYKGGMNPPVHPNCRCYEEIVDLGIVKCDPDLVGISKHLRGLHDQKTHGRRGGKQGLRPDIVRSLQAEEAKGGVRGSFAKALIRLGQEYPEVAANIRGVDISAGSLTDSDSDTAVAVTRYTANGHVILVDPSRLREAIAALDVKRKEPGFRPWGTPEIEQKYDRTTDRWWVTDDVVSDLGRDYAEAVAVHEFGHVAHWHFLATEFVEGENSDDDQHSQMVWDVRNAMDDATYVTEVKPLTNYAMKNTPEMLAEWFAGYWFGMTPKGFTDPAFVEEFERRVQVPVSLRGGVVKTDRAWHVCGGDFDGSIVESIAVGLKRQKINKARPAILQAAFDKRDGKT